jgi:hypothetical protein
MPLAKDVAKELRKLADSLDRQPEAVLQKPYISFSHYGKEQKDKFLSVCRILPKPLTKRMAYDDLRVEHKTDSLDIQATIPQQHTCELVEAAKPAVYRCAPILSEGEEMELGEEVGNG